MKTRLLFAVLIICSLQVFAQSGKFSGSGSGTSADPYQITNAMELDQVRYFTNQKNVCFKLMNDIDLKEYLDENYLTDRWEPIGSYAGQYQTNTPFKGVFDGDGHKITNLSVAKKYVDNGYYRKNGFFGMIDSATVKNLNIEGSVDGGSGNGGLVGYASNSTITNCGFKGNIGTKGDCDSGGLFFQVDDCVISYCSFSGTVGNSTCGGLASSLNHSVVSHCNVSCTFYGSYHKGGLVGIISKNGYTSTFSDCKIYANLGTTSSGYCGIGGLIGINNGNQIVCKNCSVICKGNNYSCDNPLGGIIGSNSKKVELTNCTVTDTLSSNHGVIGGLIGITTDSVGITNCKVNSQITASGDSVGGFIGCIVGQAPCTMNNSYSAGYITSGGNAVGGLVGYVAFNRSADGNTTTVASDMRMKITNCYSTGTITGNQRVGGIIGSANGNAFLYNYKKDKAYDMVDIENCYSDATMKGGAYVGGIVGYCNNYVTVKSNAALNKKITAAVKGIGRICASCGNNITMGEAGSKEENKALSTMKLMVGGTISEAPENLNNGTSTTLATLKQKDTYAAIGWDMTNTWNVDSLIANSNSPYLLGNIYVHDNDTIRSEDATVMFSGAGAGTESNPYQITNAKQLDQVRFYTNIDGVYFKMMNDIDMKDYLNENYITEGWQPIGQSSNIINQKSFKGVFDGGGHKVTNLFINSSTSNDCGFFGMISYATVKNLSISGSVEGINCSYICGLAGFAINSVISNCSFEGNIGLKNDNASRGGLFGEVSNCEISYCSYKGQIGYSHNDGAGLACNMSNSDVSNCIVNCTLNDDSKSAGFVRNLQNGTSKFTDNKCYVKGQKGSHIIYVDGNMSICGMFGSNDGILICKNCVVELSYSSSYDEKCIGGIIGQNNNNATLINCFVTDTISYYGDWGMIGGLIGITTDTVYIENCKALSQITAYGADSIGGLIGCVLNNAPCTIKNSVSAGNISSSGNAIGGLIGYVALKRSADGDALTTAEDMKMTISNCYSTGTISGNQRVGGLIGAANGSVSLYNYKNDKAYDIVDIENCYSDARVSGNKYIGGLVGYCNNYVTLKSNVALNKKLTASIGEVGRIYGAAGSNITLGEEGSTSENKALETTQIVVQGTTQQTVKGLLNGTSTSYNDLKKADTYASIGWDMTNVWGIDSAKVSSVSPYLINNVYSHAAGSDDKPVTPTPGVTKYNYIYLNDTASYTGSTIRVPVRMKNKVAITAFQFDMTLPSGITLAKSSATNQDMVELADRTTSENHSVGWQTLSNGAIRFVCYSSANKEFSGNDGAVVYVTLQVTDANAIDDGNHTIMLNNIRMSTPEAIEYVVDTMTSVINVKSFLLGDVDNSSMVSVNDAVVLVDNILKNNSSEFLLKTGDLDKNGVLSINDVTLLIRLYVLNIPSSAKAFGDEYANNGTACMDVMPFAINAGEEKTIDVLLNNPNDEVTAYQFDLNLPEGISFVADADNRYAAPAKDRLCDSHSVSSRIQTNGDLRVACISLNNDAISGTNGAVARIRVKADDTVAPGTYYLTLQNAHIAHVDGANEITPASSKSEIRVGSTTNISEVSDGSLEVSGGKHVINIAADKGQTVKVVSADGKLVSMKVMAVGESSAVEVAAGVYFVNGQKVVVK